MQALKLYDRLLKLSYCEDYVSVLTLVISLCRCAVYVVGSAMSALCNNKYRAISIKWQTTTHHSTHVTANPQQVTTNINT